MYLDKFPCNRYRVLTSSIFLFKNTGITFLIENYLYGYTCSINYIQNVYCARHYASCTVAI